MALQAKYQSYLGHPTAEALAPNAAINYIPTLSTITGSAAILKHLSAQAEQLKKTGEKFLNVIESTNSLCIETETTLQFLYGGGTYLPGMDDNFLADRTVTVMIVHVVTFNSEEKIQQIRLLWDQGSLLKSIDVIGRSGRNWPLHEGKDQARLISSSAAATPSAAGPPPAQNVARRRSRAGTNNESHTNLALFSPRTFDREDTSSNTVAPRESAKPPPREYSDLFVSGETASGQPPSPTKGHGSYFKAGAGKNFAANRLFDETPEQTDKPVTASTKTNPQKFNHFEFDDATPAVTQGKASSRANMHAAQWDFADFATPIKKPVVKRAEDARHFGYGDDEGDTADVPANNYVAKARHDASSHFSFGDVTPQADKKQAFEPEHAGTARAGLYVDHISAQSNSTNKPDKQHAFEPQLAVTGRNDLYQDHISANQTSKSDQSFEPERAGTTGRTDLYQDHISAQTNQTGTQDLPITTGKVLGNITNTSTNQHRKNFTSNWDMADGELRNDENLAKKGRQQGPAARSSEPAWSLYDGVPQEQRGGIKIAGNGMGGRSETQGSGWWDF